MCGVFRGGRMPPRKIPPAPRTRCNAPGAKAGCAFFAPGFFAQAKKGGSRRHGAKALDPDFGEPAGGQDPPDGLRRRASRGRSPDLRRILWRGAKSNGEVAPRAGKSGGGGEGGPTAGHEVVSKEPRK